MKTFKSVIAASIIAAVGTLTVTAADVLLTPRQTDSSPKVIVAQSDQGAAVQAPVLGDSAKAKLQEPALITAQTNPDLLKCAQAGKSSCKMIGSGCCQTTMNTVTCCKR